VKRQFHAVLSARGQDPPLDELCYMICQLGGHGIEIVEEQRRLDEQAGALTPTFEGVVTGLFSGPGALRGNEDDYYNVRNSMLSEVQRLRLGIPITLSVLAMEHGRRIGVPIVGIGIPGHFVIGSGDDTTLFADPFNGGALLTTEGVRQLHRRVTGSGRGWRESYLLPVSSRDIVFRILNNIKLACERGVADRDKLPWVLELMSWFPQGEPFDDRVAARAMATFN